MSSIGVNHDCKKSGVCFNDVHRLKFGVFNDCWKKWKNSKWEKSNIRPTDVDFMIEQNGNFLMLEFKANSSVFNKSSGQGIMFSKLATVANISIILCEGSAKDMTVSTMQIISKGYRSAPTQATIESLTDLLESWSKWAARNPQVATHTDRAKPSWVINTLTKTGDYNPGKRSLMKSGYTEMS
jgi:hypothetical protein